MNHRIRITQSYVKINLGSYRNKNAPFGAFFILNGFWKEIKTPRGYVQT